MICQKVDIDVGVDQEMYIGIDKEMYIPACSPRRSQYSAEDRHRYRPSARSVDADLDINSPLSYALFALVCALCVPKR